MPHPELVVFDMDGTMLDTEPVSRLSWKYATETMGYTFDDEIFNKMLGTNSTQIFNLLLDMYGNESDVKRVFELSSEYYFKYFEEHGMPVKSGIYELLDKLEMLGIKKCVATSTGKKVATHKLQMAGIADRFEIIVGGDEVHVSKPNPEIFLLAAQRCGVLPSKCLVVEDSAAGVRAGFDAGMHVVLVPDMLPPSEETRRMAHYICKDLHELMGYL